MSESVTIFRNANVLDGREETALEDQDVVVEGNLIKEVTAKRASTTGARVVDLAGKTLMPGLIDCHVHVIACLANLAAKAELPNTLVSLRAAKIIQDMLMR
ncbi:MAG: amidohydrolase family protein, partial [Pseudomonadota bacterium]